MGTIEKRVVEQDTSEEVTRRNIERRDFLKGAALGAIGLGAMTSFLGCDTATNSTQPASADELSNSEVSLLTGWSGTPAEILALGGSTMPLADLNEHRQKYLDSQTEYTCKDGSVIPAAFVKMRALVHTYGMGCGGTPHDASFTYMMSLFSEDDAQMYIEMPMGEKFSAIDLKEKTGRSLEECRELLERMSSNGFLGRFINNNGATYHHVAFFQGVTEYQLKNLMEVPNFYEGVAGIGMIPDDMANTGTPVFYAIPCDKSVVADESVLPYDDIESLFVGKKAGIAPCFCRYSALKENDVEGYPTFEDFATGNYEDYFSPLVNQRVETCLMIGDEAEYWIHRGIAREITSEEAVEFMHRSADDGFILQSCFSKDTGTICSCHADSCNIFRSLWGSIGGAEEIAAVQPFGQTSHYTLEIDYDACIKCGTCASRCALHIITMDGENGEPISNEMCFRCGQCALVCPQKARKLVQRPEDEILELPRDFVDDNNMKAAYRFEQGLIV